MNNKILDFRIKKQKLNKKKEDIYTSFHEIDGEEIYIGEYKDGKQHGKGTTTYDDDDKHVGQYKDGKFHGHGTITFADGDKYLCLN